MTKYDYRCKEVSLGVRKRPKIFLGYFSPYGENNDAVKIKGNYKGELGRLVRRWTHCKPAASERLAMYVINATIGSFDVEFEEGFGSIDVNLRIICLEVIC